MADHNVGNHNEWDELAAGYALNALTPDEELSFAAHLKTCGRCRANVDDHLLVAAQLGAIAMPEEPLEPPSWASIRTSVIGDDTPRLLPADVADVVDLGDRRHRYAVSRRVLAVAAAVVVLAGGGIIAWQVTSGGSSNAVPSAASCGSAPGCHAVSLDDAAGTQAAALTVKGDRITMVPTNMKPAPAGKEYVLWQLPADGRPVPVKVFTSTGDQAVATATTAVAYSDTASFAVSEESAGPAPSSPTTPLLAEGTAT
jgi:anti-sigma-K factor RskA